MILLAKLNHWAQLQRCLHITQSAKFIFSMLEPNHNPTHYRSLHCLPLEIRREIFRHIINGGIESTIITGFSNRNAIRASHASLRLPWLQVMLACRQFAEDIAQMVGVSKSRSPSTSFRTYELHLENQGNSSHLGQVTWLRIPCPPNCVRVLDVTLDYQSDMVTFWGDGGPAPILQHLYHLLNLFLHCGPLLNPARRLQRDVKLQKLVLRFDPPRREWVAPGVWLPFISLSRYVERLCETGVLYEYVDIVVVHECGETRELSVPFVRDAKVPPTWEGNGFDWGL